MAQPVKATHNAGRYSSGSAAMTHGGGTAAVAPQRRRVLARRPLRCQADSAEAAESGVAGVVAQRERVFLVTGATDGIGKHTATRLAERENTRVLLHGRNPARGAKALAEIAAATGNDKLEYFNADLSLLSEVHELARQVQAKHPAVDVLVNNAGVYVEDRTVTADGFELTWAVNVVAPFLLTRLLLDNITAGHQPRIVNVSSISQTEGGGRLNFDNLQHERYYDAHSAYGLSKLASVCFTYDLARKLKGHPSGVTVNCLDPGTVNTKMLLAGWGPCGIPVGSADNELFLATDESVEAVSGKYFVSSRATQSCRQTFDNDARAKLWGVLEEQSGVTYN